MVSSPPPKFRHGDAQAANSIWDWRGKTPAKRGPHPHSVARREGMIRGIIGAGIGTLIYLFWHGTLAYVVWSIATVTFLAAILSPGGVYRGIQALIIKLATLIGTVMSWILLPLLFYGFCLPFGFFARRGMKDRMERWFDRQAPTYWKTRRDPERNAEFYQRQF